MNTPKIDFVITWVDGSDKSWQKEKAKYSSTSTDDRSVRYRDWGTLKYWFRGVEQFAPWVNKIYFVTCGQVPNWLNIKNPKLVLVNHKDFIPKEYLPTFNSNAIELNLHHIKGLSEQFVLFNDDMFIVSPTLPEDFFKNGQPKDIAVFSPIMPYQDGFAKILCNNLGIINKYYNKKSVLKNHPLKWYYPPYGTALIRTLAILPWKHFVGFYDPHTPISHLKSTFSETWKKESAVLAETCQSHIRNNNTDVNHWLFRYINLCEGNFAPRPDHFSKFFSLSTDTDFSSLFKQSKKYKTICLNDDPSISDVDFKYLKQTLLANFETLLPEKSSFEKGAKK